MLGKREFFPSCHSHVGGNPGVLLLSMDSRLHGNDRNRVLFFKALKKLTLLIAPVTLCFVVLSVLFLPTVYAYDTKSVLENLQKVLDNTHTLQSGFLQEAYNLELDMRTQSGGKISLTKAGNVRWDYTSPDIQMFLITENLLLYYSQEDNQVIKRKVSKNDILNTPLSILSGTKKLSKKFKILKVGHSEVEKSFNLELIPKKNREDYQKLILQVDDKTYEIRRISITDAVGNITTINFFDQVRNKVLPENIFDFTIPAGAEVITDKDLPH